MKKESGGQEELIRAGAENRTQIVREIINRGAEIIEQLADFLEHGLVALDASTQRSQEDFSVFSASTH